MLLAQVNVALMRADLDDPRMGGFVAALEPVYRMAEESPGFGWRLRDPDGGHRPATGAGQVVNVSVLHTCARSPTAAATARPRGSSGGSEPAVGSIGMEHRYVGNSGLRVSELCLGGMTFGDDADEAASRGILDRYVDAGGNFIDTADVYTGGASEEIIGRWLATRNRDDLVVATKLFWATGDGPNDHGAGRKHILAAVDASLRRLGTDHLDLYQVHAFDESTPFEETLSTLAGLVEQGKTRHLGVSNYAAWQLQKSIDVARHRGWEPFIALQPLYNLLDRDIETELVPVCRNEGVGIIPWAPLRGGWFTGKYRRGMTTAPPDTRWDGDKQHWLGDWQRSVDERTWHVTDTVLAVADEIGRSPAQVALRWLLQRPGVTAPIVGARTVAQLDDNLGAVGWTLDDKQMERLTAAGAQPLPYPHGYLRNSPRRRH